MSASQENSKVRDKKEQLDQFFKSCEICDKYFTQEQNYETHMKIKHPVQRKKEPSDQEQDEEQEEEEQGDRNSNNQMKSLGKSVPFQKRMLELQRNQLEDNIYTFLGELGERNPEPISNRSEMIFRDEAQKLVGQTNYSINKVIRTPYEENIYCSAEIPLQYIQKSKSKNFLLQLKKQIQILEKKLDQQKQKWELIDPMSPEDEIADEFSLMDIKKLILNYPKRNLKLSYPHFSIFLLWLGRISKNQAFREFFIIIGEYLTRYYEKEENNVKGEEAYDLWLNFYKKLDFNSLELMGKVEIFDDKSIKKFIEYYTSWVNLFRGLSI